LSIAAQNARRGGQNAKASPIRGTATLAEMLWESLTVRHVEPVARANEPDPDGAKQVSQKAGKHNKLCNAGLGATVAASARRRRSRRRGACALRRLAARFIETKCRSNKNVSLKHFGTIDSRKNHRFAKRGFFFGEIVCPVFDKSRRGGACCHCRREFQESMGAGI